MKVVYIAGPFRGRNHWEIAENIRRAERVALQVWQAGAAAICPHLNTMHFQDAAPDELWLEGDLAILAKCDAVLMTPDWERSKGARAEMEFADAHRIPVFYNLDALESWLYSARREAQLQLAAGA